MTQWRTFWFNNNLAFSSIRITDYDGLSPGGKAFIREIDEKFKPSGIVCETMKFDRPEYERFVQSFLDVVGIEHTKIDDKWGTWA